MAQITILKPIGALEVFPDTTYTAANIPAAADAVVCLRGVRITDENDANTPLRGLRMAITYTGIAAVTPVASVPFIWIEGTELRFDAAWSYKFLDRGIVGYGVSVAI